ncbi:outer membrane beta-barrel protein [Salibacter halophilus]|uniref:PorT family protein n=1 Tax=Salibacter halophilus TaxID=1803916 RepID=A0A6N6M5F7_9FLAO|nr:outer membrane beta-barrel protein [Salibacter halophilus]KAB1063190.1 PorT family protein [Salibacter halophilus]
MKKLNLLLLSGGLLLSSLTFGQNALKIKKTDSDTADEGTVSFFSKGRNRVFEGIEFGFTWASYTENELNTDVPDAIKGFEIDPATSINWSINPFEMDVRIFKEYVKFSTGLGYTVKNFTLKNNYFVTKQNDSVMAFEQQNQDYAKNRFRTGYLTVPLMLHFNTNEDPAKAFRLGVGVLGGMRLFQTYRVKYFDDGQKVKTNYNRNWNTNQFTADLRGLIGYGPVNLFATYSAVPLFESGKGPEMYPITFGISFVNSFKD